MTMDKEWKEKWIAALRSGNYEQSQGQLSTLHKNGSTTFCCLGVLCDIHPDVKEVKIGPENSDLNMGWVEYYFADKNDMGRLPENFRDTLKMELEYEDQLIAMNDGDGDGSDYGYEADFKEIADYIEENM